MLIVDKPFNRPMKELQGRRCFVVGSGPSLNDTDLSLLRGQLIFALNAAATLFLDSLAYPDVYWVARDKRAAKQIVPRLVARSRLRAIVSQKVRDNMEQPARGLHSIRAFVYDEKRIVHERTVAEDALQLAKLGGCSDAVLVGVDCLVPAGRQYAEALMWKPCSWYDPKSPVPESKAAASFLRALHTLVNSGLLDGFPVYSSVPSCDAFPFMDLAHAVERRTAPVV